MIWSSTFDAPARTLGEFRDGWHLCSKSHVELAVWTSRDAAKASPKAPLASIRVLTVARVTVGDSRRSRGRCRAGAPVGTAHSTGRFLVSTSNRAFLHQSPIMRVRNYNFARTRPRHRVKRCARTRSPESGQPGSRPGRRLSFASGRGLRKIGGRILVGTPPEW